MEQQQKGSGYKIDNIFLVESTFSRQPHISFNEGGFDNQISIENEVSDEEVSESKFTVSMTLEFKAVQNEEIAFQIRIKMVGLFEKAGDAVLSEEAFKKVNAPAIIYPFIREHVSSLTLKAGIGTVLLPSVNFKI
ncbi:preprotein translocase subunit SecB [Chitinophaga skermanii]|uniref:Preprotein translocase subunit SecB n=1 Tax=Chitinophaga skermanii TaxID=331697 RepID=A0A327QK58_9BACT|nr:protein-export chaperone SecB [Chitinophaga skermanii]RAJ04072.1 preprotein translocase subunit SecB [Chitinophaga skermanii]